MFDFIFGAMPSGALSLSIPFAVSALCVGVVWWRIARSIALENAVIVEDWERT
jgi:hypothetical protein